MFSMHYDFTHSNETTENIDISVPQEDITLQELFGHFIRITEMMGYQAGSWEKIIEDVYGCCNLHVDTRDEYNIFDYALDVIPIR